MSVGVLSNLSLEQQIEIADLRRQSPIADVSGASGKARMVCAAYNREWHSTFTSYHNAILVAVKKSATNNPLRTVTLLACAEELALANMAKDYLTVDEYNLLIYPVAKITMPELFEEKQWERKPLPEGSPVSAVETHFKHIFEKKPRRPRDNSVEEVEAKGIDTDAIAAILLGIKKPKEDFKPPKKVDAAQAIKEMLSKVGKNEQKESEESEETEEAEEVIPVRVKKSDDGSYGLFNEAGDTVADGFNTPIEAISFATKEKGLKLLK